MSLHSDYHSFFPPSMASSPSISLLLLLLICISSAHLLHARDSQFFSKVTNTPTQTNTVVIPDKEVTTQETETQPEHQPDFVPQNQNEGHGLYGQEDGIETKETKSGVQTRTPATYASERYYNYNTDRNRAETGETEQFGNGETFYTKNGEKYQNDDASFDFDDSKYQNDDTSFYNNNHNGVETERYDTYTNQKDNGEKYYYTNKEQNDDELYSTNNYNGAGTEHYTTQSQKDNNLGETETYYSDNDKSNQFGNQLRQTETNYKDNGYTNELNTRYNTYRPDTAKTQNRGGSNVVRQGMSDTRFLENGKYFYDLNKEEQLQNRYANQNTYKYDAVDRVNANYDDNNNNRFYDNSGGEKYEFNTMEEYERSSQNKYDP